MQELFLIIHDVRSAHNVASMFRTADGVGVTKIFLTGITPAPVDRFGRKVPEFEKVALGAEGTMPWEQKELDELLVEFKKENVQLLALEQSSESILYSEFVPKFPTVLLVGNEVEGVPQDILKSMDAVLEIPMHGAKESLNVSVAAGVALYQLKR